MPDLLAASDGHIRAVRPDAGQGAETLAGTVEPGPVQRIGGLAPAARQAAAPVRSPPPGHARRDAPEAIS